MKTEICALILTIWFVKTFSLHSSPQEGTIQSFPNSPKNSLFEVMGYLDFWLSKLIFQLWCWECLTFSCLEKNHLEELDPHLDLTRSEIVTNCKCFLVPLADKTRDHLWILEVQGEWRIQKLLKNLLEEPDADLSWLMSQMSTTVYVLRQVSRGYLHLALFWRSRSFLWSNNVIKTIEESWNGYWLT